MVDHVKHSKSHRQAGNRGQGHRLLGADESAATCADLHIHRNTLDYRLRRIEELTGLDWADGDLMFRLYFSLCVIRYDQLSGNQPPFV